MELVVLLRIFKYLPIDLTEFIYLISFLDAISRKSISLFFYQSFYKSFRFIYPDNERWLEIAQYERCASFKWMTNIDTCPALLSSFMLHLNFTYFGISNTLSKKPPHTYIVEEKCLLKYS